MLGGVKLLLGLDKVIATVGVPRARSSVFLGPASMALQGESSELLLLPHRITEVNNARRSHAGPRKNFRDSRLRLPPHGQGRYISAISSILLAKASGALRAANVLRHHRPDVWAPE